LIIKQSTHVFFSIWSNYLINFLISIIVARELGVNGKGLAVIFVSIVNTIGIIFLLGLPTSVAYFIQKKKISLDEVRNSSFLFSALIFLICFFLINFFDLFKFFSLDFFYFEKIIFCLCVFLFINNYLFTNIILTLGDSKIYSFLIFIKSILFLLLILFLINKLKYGFLGYFYAYFISELICFIFIIFYLNFKIKIKKFNYPLMKKDKTVKVLLYGVKNFPNSLVALYSNYIINYIILLLFNTESVGIFSIAIAFHNAICSIPRAINVLLLGQMSKLKNLNSNILLLMILRFSNTMVLVIMVLGIIMTEYLIIYFYGSAFYSSILLTQIMICCSFLTCNIMIIQSKLLSQNQPLKVSIINFTTMIMSFCFLFIFYKILGLIAAPISFCISRAITYTYLVMYMRNIKINIKNMLILSRLDLKKIFKNL
jgi:O-antigen/teichoic acid export membrane protein